MANVIREDVVQVSFDIESDGISALQKIMQSLKMDTGGVDDALEDLKKTAKGTGDSLEGVKDAANDIQPKGLDKLKQHLNDTNTRAGKAFSVLKQLASVGFEKLKSGLDKVANAVGTVAKKAGKLALGGVAAGAAGVAALTGASVKAYADYEQLVGGVETLFKGSAGTVQQYANNAFKTAGISANRYMETVTSFSASMISSVGGDTAKAAKLSDMALSDMSDNANKMGSDMETLIGTYQSLARGNYAMLDNLKLGYGGTKSEMERLIKEAAKLDKTVKVGDMSFANMTKAIHAVQTKMDITGTTAKEASTTISGSFGAMKASWQDLMPALVQGGDDFDRCLANLIDSVKTFGKNIMPAITGALEGVGELISEMAPIIAKEAPEIVGTILPPLLDAASQIVASLIAELPAIIEGLIPAIKLALANIVRAIYEAFTGKEMELGDFLKIQKTIEKIVDIAEVAVPIIVGLALAFKAFSVVKTVVGGITKFAKGIGTIASKVGGGLAEKITQVGDGIDKTGKKSKTSAKNMLAGAKAFALMAVGVLAIAVAFGILAFAAISLANAGGAAIAVMGGLVIALAGLGVGMAFLLKFISSVGAKAIPAATAMVILGAAVILIAAGFALLAMSAIKLAGAGGAAIAVMFGMIAAIAVLVVIVGLFGGALIAGAVGFVIFAAGLVLCATAALIFAVAVQKMTPPLLMLIPVVGNVVNTIVNSVGTVLVNCIQAAGNTISQILQGISDIFTSFGEAVSNIVTSIGDAISGVLDSIAGIFDSIGNAALNAGNGFKLVAEGLKMISSLSIIDIGKSLTAVGIGLGEVAAHGQGLSQAGQGMQVLVITLMQMVTVAALVGNSFTTINSAITQLSTTSSQLVTQFPLLAAAMLALISPLVMVAGQFTLFAGSAAIVTATSIIIVAAFSAMVSVVMAVSSAFAMAGTALNIVSTGAMQANNALMLLVAGLMLTQTAMQACSKVFASAINAMVSTVKSGGAKMVQIMRQTVTQMATALRSANLTQAGMQLINGLIVGINSKKSAAVAAARDIATAINREFDKIQDINSPSGVWEDKGAFLIKGGIIGMQKMMPKLKTTVQTVGEISTPYTGNYTPENSSYSYSKSSRTENNSYAPVLNFNISGGGDTRATARAVKRAAKEALQEIIESMDRRTPKTIEI